MISLYTGGKLALGFLLLVVVLLVLGAVLFGTWLAG